MNRCALLVVGVVFTLAVCPSGASAQTENDRIKDGIANGRLVVIEGEHTRDACDRSNNITITSTTDGDVILRPGDVKYFRISRKDAFTRSGGWYWKCDNSLEKARLRGATIIKAVRSEKGVTDWYAVTVQQR
jgi:hypothetical protein